MSNTIGLDMVSLTPAPWIAHTYMCTLLLSIIDQSKRCAMCRITIRSGININDDDARLVSRMWQKRTFTKHSDASTKININLNFSNVVSELPHFWTSTGFW